MKFTIAALLLVTIVRTHADTQYGHLTEIEGRIQRHQAPELYAMVERHAQSLNIYPVPYLRMDKQCANAQAEYYAGDEMCIALGHELLATITPHELEAVICHELGHIKCGDLGKRVKLRKHAPSRCYYYLHYARKCRAFEHAADAAGLYTPELRQHFIGWLEKQRTVPTVIEWLDQWLGDHPAYSSRIRRLKALDKHHS